MNKFIVFTDNNEACFPHKNPFKYLNEGNTFNNRDRTIGVISFQEHWFLPNPSDFVDEFKNYDILILADKVFTETNQYISYIKAFANGEQDIHVLIHKGNGDQRDVERKQYQTELIKKALGQDFENFEEQNHSSSSIYWNELIEIAELISGESPNQTIYQELLATLKSKFPNRLKIAENNLRISLRVLCKKIQSRKINSEDEFKNELSLLKKSEKLKLVTNELDKISYVSFRAECLSPQTV